MKKTLTKGCVVTMKASSGLQGYGNPQCISSVCEPLGEISLYGHNQHYKTYDIDKILEYPSEPIEVKETNWEEIHEEMREDFNDNPKKVPFPTQEVDEAIKYTLNWLKSHPIREEAKYITIKEKIPENGKQYTCWLETSNGNYFDTLRWQNDTWTGSNYNDDCVKLYNPIALPIKPITK